MSYRVIRDGVEIGVSPTIVHIYLGGNGAYQECPPQEAQGFCVKLPRETAPVSLDGESVVNSDVTIKLHDKKLNFFGPEGCSCNRTAR